MSTKGPELRNVVNYIDDVNISKLVFESNNLSICINAWTEKLEAIKTIKGVYSGCFLISEKEYDQIICPVCFVQANVGFKGQEGFVNGVIRPEISRDVTSKDFARILPNTPQRFHFYYESLDNRILGLSTCYTIGNLLIQLMDWNVKDHEKFKKEFMRNPRNTVPPEFEVKIDYEKNSDNRKYGRFQII